MGLEIGLGAEEASCGRKRVSEDLEAGASQPLCSLGCGSEHPADAVKELGWSQESRCRSHVLGTYTEAKGYYHHSKRTGVCSEQQYEPFVQKTEMESK